MVLREASEIFAQVELGEIVVRRISDLIHAAVSSQIVLGTVPVGGKALLIEACCCAYNRNRANRAGERRATSFSEDGRSYDESVFSLLSAYHCATVREMGTERRSRHSHVDRSVRGWSRVLSGPPLHGAYNP